MWGDIKFECEVPKPNHAKPVSPNEDKGGTTAWLKVTETIFFVLGFVCQLFFYESKMFQMPALFWSSGKEAPNLVDPSDHNILSH